MYYIKYLAIIIAFLLLQSPKLLAEKIVYLNIEKIMKTSKAGKSIIKKINETQLATHQLKSSTWVSS